jgi:hypothetical protein
LIQLPKTITIGPLVDYSKSIIIIADDCICTMKEMAPHNKALEKEKEMKRIEAKLTKE